MIWVLQINNKQDIRTFKQTTQKQKNRIDIDNHSYLCYISFVDWLNQSSPLEHRVLTQLLVNKEQLGWKILGESLLAPAPFLILFCRVFNIRFINNWDVQTKNEAQKASDTISHKRKCESFSFYVMISITGWCLLRQKSSPWSNPKKWGENILCGRFFDLPLFFIFWNWDFAFFSDLAGVRLRHPR